MIGIQRNGFIVNVHVLHTATQQQSICFTANALPTHNIWTQKSALKFRKQWFDHLNINDLLYLLHLTLVDERLHHNPLHHSPPPLLNTKKNTQQSH